MRSPGRLTTAVLLPLLILVAGSAYGDPNVPELVVNITDVEIDYEADSVMMEIYFDNPFEACSGVDLWINLGHAEIIRFAADSVYECDSTFFNCLDSTCTEFIGDSCIAWEFSNCQDTTIECEWEQKGAIRLAGTAIEDWEQIDVIVQNSQRTLIQLFGIANNGGGTPPVAAGSNHLLAKIVCEVSGEGFQIPDTMCPYWNFETLPPDSVCDSTYFIENYLTPVVIQSRSQFSNADGNDLIGWKWTDPFCVDSTCIDWNGPDCIEWQCNELDSTHFADTNAIKFFDGEVELVGCPQCQGCDWVVGDANGNSYIDIDDVVYLISYIFNSGPPPIPVLDAGNANCASEPVDIDDVVYLIAFIFASGPPPPCECGDLL